MQKVTPKVACAHLTLLPLLLMKIVNNLANYGNHWNAASLLPSSGKRKKDVLADFVNGRNVNCASIFDCTEINMHASCYFCLSSPCTHTYFCCSTQYQARFISHAEAWNPTSAVRSSPKVCTKKNTNHNVMSYCQDFKKGGAFRVTDILMNSSSSLDV